MIKETVYYWPLWLSKSLSKKDQDKVKKILAKIQRAQVFLWRALNIYDDFFDGAGKTIELPKANKYLRDYLTIHYDLNLSSDYYRNLNIIFNNLDRANCSEIQQTKLKIINGVVEIPNKLPAIKNMGTLSDKSLALALGPIALLDYLSYPKYKKDMPDLLNFFRYTLAAKQLSDDSHDWLEDLRNGLVTRANKPIIQAAKTMRLKLSISGSPVIANLLYAEVAAPLILCDLKRLCQLARKSLNKFDSNHKNILITKFIKPIEVSVLKAKRFRDQVVENNKIMI